MSLPKIDMPISNVNVPSTKKLLSVRPMKVSDEKILLQAKETRNINSIFLAIKQILGNCILDEFDVNTLTLFDVDYLFIQLRSISIGKNIHVVYKDLEDGREYDVDIDLDQVKLTIPDQDFKIKINDKSGLVLRYPTCQLYESPIFKNEDVSSQDIFDEVLINCLDKYYNGETTESFKDYKPSELVKFVEDLDLKTYAKLKTFIENLPTVYHKASYTNSKGTVQVIESKSLPDFFTFV